MVLEISLKLFPTNPVLQEELTEFEIFFKNFENSEIC